MKTGFFSSTWAALAALMLLGGCQQTIQIQLNDYDPKVVVMSHCIVDSVPVVFLSMSESAFGYISNSSQEIGYNTLTLWLEGASVSLTEDETGQTQALTGATYRIDTISTYVELPNPPYYTYDTVYQEILAYTGTIPLKADKSYTLKVEHAGKTYTSTNQHLPTALPVFLQEIQEELSNEWGYLYAYYNLQWKGKPNAAQNFTVIQETKAKGIVYIPIYDTLPDGSIIISDYNTDTIWNSYSYTYNTSLTADNQGVYTLSVYSKNRPETITGYDTIYFNIAVSPSEEAENRFYETYYAQTNNGTFNNPFQEPVPIYSNITNGLGYFCISQRRDTAFALAIPY